MSNLCEIERPSQDRDGLVVHAQRHWEWMAVLPAMREREARGVVESCWRSVHDFGDEGQ